MSRITILSKLYVHIAYPLLIYRRNLFWLLDPVFLYRRLKKMYHLNDIITFVENKITAHLNLILLIEAGRQTLSTVWLLSVWRCLSVNDITFVSVSLGVYSGVYNDKRGRPTDQNIWYLFYQVYTVLYKHFIYHDSRVLFIYPDLKIQAGLLNIDTGVNSTKQHFLSFILNVIYTVYFW